MAKTPPSIWKPTRQQLAAAYGKKVPDLIAANLKVLFVGINPGLYSAAVRHHFGRPGNRFWPALHLSGFTARQLSPFEETELLIGGYGITNLVQRATAAADELTAAEIAKGAHRLASKVRRHRPAVVAILGMGAYRTGFQRPGAGLGAQPERIGTSRLWVLPNPSGLNANYQLPQLVALFCQLKQAADGIAQQRKRAKLRGRPTIASSRRRARPE